MRALRGRERNSSVTQRPDLGSRTALIKLRLPLASIDAATKKNKRSRPKTSAVEAQYRKALHGVAKYVAELVKGLDVGKDPEKLPTLIELLNSYATLLKPWARYTALRMIQGVNDRDRDMWRNLGQDISHQLRQDILHSPVGAFMRQRLEENVDLITSIPRQAGERVHELTLKGLENSTRAREFEQEILNIGELTASRATLIARTEVARTAALLTQARSEQAGITHYIWETSEDADVRPGHKAMQGKVCEWANPPAVHDGVKTEHYHPGETFNCRCWARPIIPE